MSIVLKVYVALLIHLHSYRSIVDASECNDGKDNINTLVIVIVDKRF